MITVVKLVIIDDDVRSLDFMCSALASTDVSIEAFSDPKAGLAAILLGHPDIAVVDLMMPGLNGMDLLDQVVKFDPSIEVIMITGHYSYESAVRAIKKGAADYLTKPVDLATLRARLKSLVAQARRKRNLKSIESDLIGNSQFEGMVGNSVQMWELFSMIRRVASHYRVALITGATGTGKEFVARALHHLSPHSAGPFVAVNCSAVVETLFESELFGHVKGSFTGATHDKVGLIEHANNGTLFLDEIGDMPLALQSKLLRVLQDSEVQRLGSLVPRKINLRVLAATHCDLRAAIKAKRFREDLFYRLSMIEIEVPRMIDRDGDLGLLTRHFIAKFSKAVDKEIRGITRRAQIVLERHDWPGNVRELENAIGHACILLTNDTIDISDLPRYLHPAEEPHHAPAEESQISHHLRIGEMPSLESQERTLVLEALTVSGGNQAKAARMLHVSRDVLRYRMKKHKIVA